MKQKFYLTTFTCLIMIVCLNLSIPNWAQETARGGSVLQTEENIPEEENIYVENNGIQFIYFDANEICNTSSLKDIEIEFTVLYDELASIRMTAINDEKNIPTKKFTLMKYAKSNYGDFDTGFDPETFNDFYHWRKNKSLVIYSRTINKDNIWDEEIYITNDQYEEAINLALSGEIEIKNSNE